MRRSFKKPGYWARTVGAFVLATALLAAPVVAQGLREFSGRVTAVSGSSIQVENRQGDALAFQKAANVAVGGSKSQWGALAVGDAVTVSWKLEDQPRTAHRVRVR